MGLISWLLVGLLAGLLAKLVMPGDDPGGIIVTIIIGVVGAFVGGFVVGLVGGTGVTGFNVWSILVATLGAIILLALYRLIARRAAETRARLRRLLRLTQLTAVYREGGEAMERRRSYGEISW